MSGPMDESADQYEISALKKTAPQELDLMRPGNGTPWEDRGALGLVAAFLKTCFESMFRPALLLDHLRRPDTTTDASSFAWLCGICWGLGMLLWDVITYIRASAAGSAYDVNGQQYAYETAARVLATPVIIFLFRGFCAKLFVRLSNTELKGVPAILPYNLFAYCLGPSILAIIPYVGMPIAAIWILIDMMIAARKRLYLSKSGAIVNTIIVYFSGAGLIVAGYFAVQLLFPWIMQPGLKAKAIPKPTTPSLYHAPPST